LRVNKPRKGELRYDATEIGNYGRLDHNRQMQNTPAEKPRHSLFVTDDISAFSPFPKDEPYPSFRPTRLGLNTPYYLRGPRFDRPVQAPNRTTAGNPSSNINKHLILLFDTSAQHLGSSFIQALRPRTLDCPTANRSLVYLTRPPTLCASASVAQNPGSPP
jgi:hypothetical protein